MTLPDELLTLLRSPALCFVTTLMPDGSPQTTETWVDTDGENVIVNTVDGNQKLRNIARDARVSAVICNPAAPRRYAEVRGRVVDTTAEGGWEHINTLSQKYTGGPYHPWTDQPQTRIIVTIAPDKVNLMGG